MIEKKAIWIIGLFFTALLATAAYAQVGAVLDAGGNGYVLASPSSSLNTVRATGSLTIMQWINIKNVNTDECFGTLSNDAAHVIFWCNSNDMGSPYTPMIHQYINEGTNFTWCKSDVLFTPNVWYHFAVAIEPNGTNRIYVNGELTSDFGGNDCDGVPVDETLNDDFYVNLLSYLTGGRGYPVDGMMDEVRIFNRSLSLGEINEDYNRGLSHLPNNITDGLNAYWKFDGDSLDYSGNGNNGTFNGNARTVSFILGNSSDVTASGIESLNVFLAGSSLLNGTYTGIKDFELKDGANLIFNLSHDFTKSMIDLAKISITRSGNDIVFNLSDMLSAGDVHSFYVPDNGWGLHYCPYAKTISDVSQGCSNEVSFTNEEAYAVTKKTIVGGAADGSWVNASVEGTYYKIMTNSTADDGGGGNPAPPVPEFSTITTILALIIVLSGFFMMRNNKRV